jgi:hypothetical protein
MVIGSGAVAGVGSASARVPRTAPAQTDRPPVQRATLVAADGDGGDRFGWSAAVAGDTALVGAPTDEDPNGDQAGSAYVFERAGDGWDQAAKLAPDDGDSGDLFGVAVALEEGTALVGARRDEDPAGAGSAYVFERNGGEWTERDKLVPETITTRALFGWSVALTEETALVGAPRDSSGAGENAGSVFVFERAEGAWEQQATLIPEGVGEGDFVGTALDIDGETAVVGATGTADPNGTDAGSAHVFERAGDGWDQAAKLVPDDGDEDDRFGHAVAFDGETALVSAVGDEDPNGEEGGSAYVFERGDREWAQATKLAPDDGAEGDEFGWSAAVAGETALVGARRNDDPNGEDGGAVYRYETVDGEWAQSARVAPDDGSEGALAGSSVELAGEVAFVGAPTDTASTGDGSAETGSVAVFDLAAEETPTPTPSPTPTPREVSTPTETPGSDGPGFGVVATLSGLAGWLWWRHSRSE